MRDLAVDENLGTGVVGVCHKQASVNLRDFDGFWQLPLFGGITFVAIGPTSGGKARFVRDHIGHLNKLLHLSNQGQFPAAYFLRRESLRLAGRGVVLIVMLEAEYNEILVLAVTSVPRNVSNLYPLWTKIA